MRPVSNFCDYFVIVSASSVRRAQTIADAVSDSLKPEDLPVRAKEGYPDSEWILVDLFDVVLHIFYGPKREFYSLENIWQDAPRLKFPAKKYGHRRMRRTTKSAPRGVAP